MNETSCARKHIVPCVKRDSGCEWKLTATNQLEDDPIAWVRFHPVWCSCWRENNDKSKIINACDPDFAMNGGTT